MPTVYIALGTNLGDREKNLHEAVRLLNESGVRITKLSRFYETEPVDYLEQPWFLNAAAEAETDLSARDLLRHLRAIESQMGSQKQIPKGPRLVDLDILLYADALIDTPDLQVPHPRMLLRNFVMIPLSEIAPGLRHPSWRGPASALAADTNDPSQVRPYRSSTK